MPVDAPYADAKSLLLQIVAQATRCQAVFASGLSLTHVVGCPSDLATVEMLFTSLLVQAQHALTEAARAAPPGARSRSQSFRSAFLLAFTHRIGDRLTEANAHVFATPHADADRFLPVLRSREITLDDFLTQRFGERRTSAVRGGYDRAGWTLGTIAADAAQLSFGDLPDVES